MSEKNEAIEVSDRVRDAVGLGLTPSPRVTRSGAAAVGVMMFAGPEKWVHRRVHKISFVGARAVQREVSIDLTMPWLVQVDDEHKSDDFASGKAPLEPSIDLSQHDGGTDPIELFIGDRYSAFRVSGSSNEENPDRDAADAATRIPFLPIGVFPKIETDQQFLEQEGRVSEVLRNFSLFDSSGKSISFTDHLLSANVAREILRDAAEETPPELTSGDAMTVLCEIVDSSPSEGAARLALIDESWKYRGLARTFADSLIGGVAAGISAKSGDRIVIKYRFWEHIETRNESAMKKFAKSLIPWLEPWGHHWPTTVFTPDAGLCSSFHVEIVPPEGIRLQRAEFVAIDSGVVTPSWIKNQTTRLSDLLGAAIRAHASPIQSRDVLMDPIFLSGPSHSLAHLYINHAALQRWREQVKNGLGFRAVKTLEERVVSGRSVKCLELHPIDDLPEPLATSDVGVRVDLRPRLGHVPLVGALGCFAVFGIQICLVAASVWNWPRDDQAALAVALLLGVMVLLTGTYIRQSEGTFSLDAVLGPRIWIGICFMSAVASAATLAFGPDDSSDPTTGVWNSMGATWFGYSGCVAWYGFLILSGVATVRLVMATRASLRRPANTTFLAIVKPRTRLAGLYPRAPKKEYLDLPKRIENGTPKSGLD